jgi:hypothetical protein
MNTGKRLAFHADPLRIIYLTYSDRSRISTTNKGRYDRKRKQQNNIV